MSVVLLHPLLRHRPGLSKAHFWSWSGINLRVLRAVLGWGNFLCKSGVSDSVFTAQEGLETLQIRGKNKFSKGSGRTEPLSGEGNLPLCFCSFHTECVRQAPADRTPLQWHQATLAAISFSLATSSTIQLNPKYFVQLLFSGCALGAQTMASVAWGGRKPLCPPSQGTGPKSSPAINPSPFELSFPARSQPFPVWTQRVAGVELGAVISHPQPAPPGSRGCFPCFFLGYSDEQIFQSAQNAGGLRRSLLGISCCCSIPGGEVWVLQKGFKQINGRI